MFLPGCPGKPKPRSSETKLAVPDFTLPALDGSTVTLSKLKGKLVVLDFWGTWCGPCRKSVPELVKLHETFGSKGVTFLGIALRDSLAAVAAFQKEQNIGYPLLLGDNKVARDYAIEGVPTLIVLNRRGEVAYKEVGFDPDSGLVGLERILNRLSGGKDAKR